jgi:hypothetical protein
LGAVAGPIGIAAAGVVVLGAAAVEAGKQVYAFARAQEAEIRKLAEVGPQQAAAVARLDAERVGRDIRTANETGGSSEQLIASLSRFEEALRPIEVVLTNLANTIGSSLLDNVTDVVKFVEPLANLLIDIYNAIPGRKISKEHLKRPAEETTWDFVKGLENEARRNGIPQWPNLGNGGRARG